MIEYISRMPFDVNTDTSKVHVWPPVTTANGLTAENNFGGCASFSTCESIEEFDGVSFNRERDGFRFGVSINVRYVDEDDPTIVTGSQTFAKEVTVSVTNPHMSLGGNPVTLQMRRVITYDKVTDI